LELPGASEASGGIGSRSRLRPFLIAGGAALAALPVWLIGTEAWPEIVVPAYFTLKGRLLYDTIIFPHTPLLILVTALLGKGFGLSPILFRAIVSLCMAAGGAWVAASSRWGLLAGVPAYIIWAGHAGGITLWPDPLMAPLALAAGLALERRGFRTAALFLGTCIVTKQTSAWLLLAAVAWLFASRNRKAILPFIAWASAPYALFAVAWGALFRTTSHIYWTLIVPLSGHAGEIVARPPETLVKAAAMFAIVPIFLLMTAQWRSPLPWLALGALGMAWPRVDILHMSAAVAILAVLTARCAESLSRRNAAAFVLAIGVALGAAALTHWRWGAGVYYWEDRASRFYTAEVRRHVPPGGAFLNYNTQYETLYAITGTDTPLTTYVNPRFWYYLNKRGLGETFCRELESRHGTPVLFSWLDARTDDLRIARTCVYRILSSAPVVEPINPATSWRVIR
jgi:hypothetical protein